MDNLIGPDEPCGTFHDSVIRRLDIDYGKKSLTADIDVCCGDPESKDAKLRERYRPGRLKIEGLVFWCNEAAVYQEKMCISGLWISDDGPLNACPAPEAKALMQWAAGKEFAWYFFFGELNAFAYVAGDRVSFEWNRGLP